MGPLLAVCVCHSVLLMDVGLTHFKVEILLVPSAKVVLFFTKSGALIGMATF